MTSGRIIFSPSPKPRHCLTLLTCLLTPLPFLLWFLPEYTDLDIMVRAGMTLVYARWLSGQLYVERSPPLMIMPVGQHDRQFGSIAQSAKHCPNNSIDSERSAPLRSPALSMAIPLTNATPGKDAGHGATEIQLVCSSPYDPSPSYPIEVPHKSATPDPCIIPSSLEGHTLIYPCLEIRHTARVDVGSTE
jgi:hypothetical protein